MSGPWAIPAEPGPEVTAVRCQCCNRVWEREANPDPVGYDAWIPAGLGRLGRRSWRAVVTDHSAPEYPLTDASEDGAS